VARLGFAVDEVETNIVFFACDDARALCAELEHRHQVRMGPVGPHRVRALTHLDVSSQDVQAALNALELVVRG
jgi:threonine aldolase